MIKIIEKAIYAKFGSKAEYLRNIGIAPSNQNAFEKTFQNRINWLNDKLKVIGKKIKIVDM